MGNATEQLVSGNRRCERARGYLSPFFVDIRIRRSGRAQGFIGRAFEEVVGRSRYWMDRLGNEKVASGEAGIQIRRPEVLLELALEKREKSQS